MEQTIMALGIAVTLALASAAFVVIAGRNFGLTWMEIVGGVLVEFGLGLSLAHHFGNLVADLTMADAATLAERMSIQHSVLRAMLAAQVGRSMAAVGGCVLAVALLWRIWRHRERLFLVLFRGEKPAA